jgi:hypothetical protein
VYHRWTERRHERWTTEEIERFNVAAPDINLGLGLDFTAFGREMFVESRLHGSGFGTRVPSTLGIRF